MMSSAQVHSAAQFSRWNAVERAVQSHTPAALWHRLPTSCCLIPQQHPPSPLSPPFASHFDGSVHRCESTRCTAVRR